MLRKCVPQTTRSLTKTPQNRKICITLCIDQKALIYLCKQVLLQKSKSVLWFVKLVLKYGSYYVMYVCVTEWYLQRCFIILFILLVVHPSKSGKFLFLLLFIMFVTMETALNFECSRFGDSSILFKWQCRSRFEGWLSCFRKRWRRFRSWEKLCFTVYMFVCDNTHVVYLYNLKTEASLLSAQ